MNGREITSAQDFIELADTNYAFVRWCTASTELWLDILEKYPNYIGEVALNKQLPDPILELLADSDDWRMRQAIASKNRLPVSVLQKLYGDENDSIRRSVVGTRNTPQAILEKMVGDKWDEIDAIARFRLSHPHIKKWYQSEEWERIEETFPDPWENTSE